MIDVLFGGRTAERVLLFLENYGDGYAREIAETFDVPVSMVQRQLTKLEDAGVLVSRLRGRTRLFVWNPRYALLEPLRMLLRAALDYVPAAEREQYFRQRRRPRRSGKP